VSLSIAMGKDGDVHLIRYQTIALATSVLASHMGWSRSGDGVVEFSKTAVKDHFEALQDPQKRRHVEAEYPCDASLEICRRRLLVACIECCKSDESEPVKCHSAVRFRIIFFWTTGRSAAWEVG